MKEKPIHPTDLTCKIILFLSNQSGRWCTWGEGYYMPSVQQVFPIGTSEEDQLKFMQELQKQGLVGGCDCGCRGDYTPTPEGLDLIAEDSVSGAQEKDRYLKNGFSFN